MICEFSGLTVPECQDSICDCFRDIDPENPGSLRPEVFVVGPSIRKEGTPDEASPPF